MTNTLNYRCSGIFYLLLLMASTACAQRQASFSYIGCFIDFAGGVRDMKGIFGLSQLGSYSVNIANGFVSFSEMTWSYCSSACSLGGFPYFALQASIGFYCGSSYGSQGQASQSQCSSTCGGNASQICGGSSRNSVFAQTYLNQNTFAAAAPINLTRTASYTLPTFWTISAGGLSECLVQCNAASCQAVIFSQQELLCYRLRFAAVPAELAGVSGDFFARV